MDSLISPNEWLNANEQALMKIFSKYFDKTLLKFLLVGVANTIVGSGVMFIFYDIFNFSYWISSICNYVVGGICSFFLNKYFTFKTDSTSLMTFRQNFKQVALFILNLVICYLIAYIAAKKLIAFFLSSSSLTEKMQGNIALLVGMVLYTILNYLGQRIFVFESERKKNV